MSQTESLADIALLSGRVLVVDDDTLVRTAIENAITRWGCTVVLAANREEALHRCRESARAPDVTVCGMQLPNGVSGIEVGKELQREFESMRILLMSADHSDECKIAASQAGFGLLKIPVRPASLRAALQLLLADSLPTGGIP